jgi:hypothetical protein
VINLFAAVLAFSNIYRQGWSLPGANVIGHFYGRNLGMFVKVIVFVPGRVFQPSLLFVSKV